jgi:HAD superfamily hydrolase (TIGR01493 family)
MTQSPKCIAFDCFGTIFDMTNIQRSEISDYVEHVRRDDFSPYAFPVGWWNLKPHRDSADGIRLLQKSGIACVAMSNGSVELIGHISSACGIRWNEIIDLRKAGVYKPHRDAYRVIQTQAGYLPHETLMVTANPSFGDLEGAESIGMPSMVIRAAGYPIRNTIELAEYLGC